MPHQEYTFPIRMGIVTGVPHKAIAGRQATIYLNNTELFSSLVYDTNPETSKRSSEQAAINITRLFVDRLQKLMEFAE